MKMNTLKKFTHEDRLAESERVAQQLYLLILRLVIEYPEDANLDEAQQFSDGIIQNLIGHKRDLKNPPALCTCRKCDSCMAAQSDVLYDKKRDEIYDREDQKNG